MGFSPYQGRATKQTVSIILGALSVATVVYIAMTYLVAIPKRSGPPGMAMVVNILGVAAAASCAIGYAVETALLRRADSPNAVQTAVIVSAACGEASAVMGLLAFFLTGQRYWVFFALSLLYSLRLLLRLPQIHRLMDEKESLP